LQLSPKVDTPKGGSARIQIWSLHLNNDTGVEPQEEFLITKKPQAPERKVEL